MKEFFSLKVSLYRVSMIVTMSLWVLLVCMISLIMDLKDKAVQAESNYQETVAIIQSGNLRAVQSYKQGYKDGYFAGMVNCALQSCENSWIIDMNGYGPVK